ncbi:MAG: hypothetical protein ACRDCI_11810 [Plesiomonas shigelloides]
MGKKYGVRSTDGKGIELLRMRMDKLKDYAVSVGVHESAGQHKDSGTTVAQIAAVHEFGATIKHPGGTKFTKIFGVNRFVKTYGATGFSADGITKAHDINIPERSFFRTTLDANQKKYQATLRKVVKRAIEGNGGDPKVMMGKFGRQVQNDIQAKIVEIKDPPNKPATIKRKKSDNPLVDTGQMLGSIKWEYLNVRDAD